LRVFLVGEWWRGGVMQVREEGCIAFLGALVAIGRSWPVLLLLA